MSRFARLPNVNIGRYECKTFTSLRTLWRVTAPDKQRKLGKAPNLWGSIPEACDGLKPVSVNTVLPLAVRAGFTRPRRVRGYRGICLQDRGAGHTKLRVD